MCALFGWLDYKGIVSDKLLKKLTQALANAAEERGTDASGIAYVKSDKVTIYKRPKPAHKIRFNAPNGTRAVMGHTRMTTQGNEKFNYNNHPFYGHADVDFAFAHNGVLYNDEKTSKARSSDVLQSTKSLKLPRPVLPGCPKRRYGSRGDADRRLKSDANDSLDEWHGA